MSILVTVVVKNTITLGIAVSLAMSVNLGVKNKAGSVNLRIKGKVSLFTLANRLILENFPKGKYSRISQLFITTDLFTSVSLFISADLFFLNQSVYLG